MGLVRCEVCTVQGLIEDFLQSEISPATNQVTKVAREGCAPPWAAISFLSTSCETPAEALSRRSQAVFGLNSFTKCRNFRLLISPGLSFLSYKWEMSFIKED